MWDFSQLYIILFLHQTTTGRDIYWCMSGCISYYSYIKPQLNGLWYFLYAVVYRTIPTSNHNCRLKRYTEGSVVYRTIPTSNHNSMEMSPLRLLVVYRTIPTSNPNLTSWGEWTSTLYIVLFLHQTTTVAITAWFEGWLYIVLFLHQTTTVKLSASLTASCISYYSYIKPQLPLPLTELFVVVYRTIPTSNHNFVLCR